jgi:2-hydroxychromene-2-carboxylate isomerase
MSTELATIKLYYDFKSPFTYLAMGPAYHLMETHRVRIRYIPHVFDFKAYGGELPNRTERDWRKVRYLYRDVRRFANERGIIIRGPERLFDSRLALKAGMWADKHSMFRPFADRVFERFFKRELNIEDVGALRAIMDEIGLESAGFAHYADHEALGDLEQAAAEAERDEVFGVPTFIVDGEPFWGNDRVVWLVKKLDTMGLRREGAGAAR